MRDHSSAARLNFRDDQPNSQWMILGRPRTKWRTPDFNVTALVLALNWKNVISMFRTFFFTNFWI